MTGPKGNSESCFPEILNVPRGEASQLKIEQYRDFLQGICRCFKGARPDNVRVES